MNFIDAMKKLYDKKKVRRKVWETNAYIYLGLSEDTIYDEDYEYFNFDQVHFFANDWEEYIEFHSFEDALKALKEGKMIRRGVDYYVLKLSDGKFQYVGYPNLKVYIFPQDILANDWIIIEVYKPTADKTFYVTLGTETGEIKFDELTNK